VGCGRGGRSLPSANPDNGAAGGATDALCGGLGGEGVGGLAWDKYQPIATPIPPSPRLPFRCVSGGGSMKNSAFSSAVQPAYSIFDQSYMIGLTIPKHCIQCFGLVRHQQQANQLLSLGNYTPQWICLQN
jgi:hypothetical protein